MRRGVPVPKFLIGDTVWLATTERKKVTLRCPDCLGTRQWRLSSPAGTECTCECPRCSTATTIIRGQILPSLSFHEYWGTIKSLTIGSVHIDTNKDHPIRYMCPETGIGSGSIHEERFLFPTKEEALAAAQTLAQEENAKSSRVRAQRTTAQKFSEIQMKDAFVHLDWQQVAQSTTRCSRLLCWVEDYVDAAEVDGRAILEEDALRELREILSEADGSPVEELILAAIKEDADAVRRAVARLPRPLPTRPLDLAQGENL